MAKRKPKPASSASSGGGGASFSSRTSLTSAIIFDEIRRRIPQEGAEMVEKVKKTRVGVYALKILIANMCINLTSSYSIVLLYYVFHYVR